MADDHDRGVERLLEFLDFSAGVLILNAKLLLVATCLYGVWYLW